ncbi:AlbA family DNA-binding domain-containing protein [Labrys monachus]|uniref:HTH transcriptional regulator n=1 Tax=Labrys monachus TaxID=217067 RepID=A0ABU0F7I1_9HYPH|nr:ATP-binding protein [Labrys monachus]MDQ0390568.1 putative HTH transcriptional regulator [Labrys monachus]
MIPETLDGWTFDVVRTLCEQLQPEGERHDFKFEFQEPCKTTKICCAFANAYGGFLVVGVRDGGPPAARPEGIRRSLEILKVLRDKVKAEPEIEIRGPRPIPVPGSEKVIYVFEVPRSERRPHLPSRKEDRVFWKRLGSQCEQKSWLGKNGQDR